MKVGDWVDIFGIGPTDALVGQIESIDADDDSPCLIVRLRHPDGRTGSYRDDRIHRIIDDPIELLALVARLK